MRDENRALFGDLSSSDNFSSLAVLLSSDDVLFSLTAPSGAPSSSEDAPGSLATFSSVLSSEGTCAVDSPDFL